MWEWGYVKNYLHSLHRLDSGRRVAWRTETPHIKGSGKLLLSRQSVAEGLDFGQRSFKGKRIFLINILDLWDNRSALEKCTSPLCLSLFHIPLLHLCFINQLLLFYYRPECSQILSTQQNGVWPHSQHKILHQNFLSSGIKMEELKIHLVREDERWRGEEKKVGSLICSNNKSLSLMHFSYSFSLHVLYLNTSASHVLCQLAGDINCSALFISTWHCWTAGQTSLTRRDSHSWGTHYSL